jgi:hypothetical protein
MAKRLQNRLQTVVIAELPLARAVKKTRRFQRVFEVGGTGLEPVTPSLSSRGDRSRPFAPVRPERMVARNRSASERLAERERYVERCHCCHASVSPGLWSSR